MSLERLESLESLERLESLESLERLGSLESLERLNLFYFLVQNYSNYSHSTEIVTIPIRHILKFDNQN